MDLFAVHEMSGGVHNALVGTARLAESVSLSVVSVLPPVCPYPVHHSYRYGGGDNRTVVAQ